MSSIGAMGVRIAALVAPAALLLAACSTVHPGAAAVVDGERIALSDVDATASAYCLLTSAQGQQVDAATLRRQAVADHVALGVARDLAEERGVRVPQSSWRVPAAGREQLAEQVGRDDVDDVVRAAELNGRLFATLEALGGPGGGAEPAEQLDDAQRQEAGRALVAEELARRDVELDPRLGLDASLAEATSRSALAVSTGEPSATGCA